MVIFFFIITLKIMIIFIMSQNALLIKIQKIITITIFLHANELSRSSAKSTFYIA